MGRQSDLWVHYPANDELPEHYSSPYAIIERIDGRWFAWLLTPAIRSVSSPDEIRIEKCLGSYGISAVAKMAVMNAVNGAGRSPEIQPRVIESKTEAGGPLQPEV